MAVSADASDHRLAVDTAVMLSLRELAYTYPGAASAAISEVSLDVRAGEFVSVVGPSGCGKSTLLSTVAGLLGGYHGSMCLRGDALTGPHPDIGVVFQEDTTFGWHTALRNVEFGLQIRGLPRGERRRKAREMLDLVGLADAADLYPAQLSGGMKQRVAIARTLVTEPSLLLMDEPFGALDEQTRMALGEELLRVQQQLGQTVLFITHSITESILLSDRVVLMSRNPGRIKDILPVDFPRPRDPGLIGTPEFGALAGKVWQSVRSEAILT